jgi:hypothetical protein
MRRHVPRDSPNSTRELGPIDATSLDVLLGPERITTQSRETKRTHRVDPRAAADVAGGVGRGSGATAIAGGVFGGVATAAIGRATACGATIGVLGAGTLSTRAIVARGAALSARWVVAGLGAAVGAATRSAVVSALGRGGAGFAASIRPPDGPLFRRNHAAPIVTTIAATPTPLQTSGAMGACSGVVPHHRHFPKLSG